MTSPEMSTVIKWQWLDLALKPFRPLSIAHVLPSFLHSLERLPSNYVADLLQDQRRHSQTQKDVSRLLGRQTTQWTLTFSLTSSLLGQIQG